MTEIEQAKETIKKISDLDFKLHLNIRQYDLLTALEALKEKAEREKGCEYCNKNFQHNYNWLIRDYMLNDKERPRIEITGDGIAVIECDYCPKCGRKLVSEE